MENITRQNAGCGLASEEPASCQHGPRRYRSDQAAQHDGRCLMEDTSATALIWSDGLALEARIETLSIAAAQIEALVAAARALLQPRS